MAITTTILEIRATPKHLQMEFKQYAGIFSDAYVNIGTVDWGDGTVDTNWSHTYSKAGTYTITIKDCGVILFMDLPLLTKIIQLSDTVPIQIFALAKSKKLTTISNAIIDDYSLIDSCYQFYFGACRKLISIDNVKIYFKSNNNQKAMRYMFESIKHVTHVNIDVILQDYVE